MHLRIEKIGGENSAALRETLGFIEKNRRNGISALYVFSAFRTSEYNTTTELLATIDACQKSDITTAVTIFDQIQVFYRETLEDMGYMDPSMSVFVDELFAPYRCAITESFQTVGAPLMEENDFSIMGLSFLGAGEVITTAIYERLIFGESGRGAISPADRDSYDQLPEFLTRGYIALSPGYYAGLPGGIIATWGRGYSDATATRIHDTIHELFPDWTLTLAIRKMYPICSADPRRIDIHRVKKLAHISLKLLLEMIGTHGASGQFINQNAANPLFFENGGRLQIYTEDDPLGSLISLSGNPSEKGILFVQSKAIYVFLITSYQFNTPGYTEHIGHFFTRAGINIDNIVTSQTEMSITVADKDLRGRAIAPLQNALLQSLREFESPSRISPAIRIEEYANLYIGGENIDFPGILNRITEVLRKEMINIALMMQPLHPQVIIIGVRRSDEYRAIDCLHREFIEQVPIS